MNEQTNTSAYASAESSPNSSLTPSSSSFQANLENLNINHIANEENHRNLMNELMINHSKSSIPISHSSNSLEKLSNGNNHPLSSEFQSLPPAQSTQSLNEKKEDVKSIINNVVKSSLSDIPKTTQQSPNKNQTSPGTSKSAVMSFLGKMLNKRPSVTSTTTAAANNTADNNCSMKSSNSSLSVASSSSPNPDCSPYKLLASEIPPQQTSASPNQLTSTNKLGTLSPNGTTINDAVAIFKAASSSSSSSTNTTENIEKLASLNHKEHEKADPVLSTNNLTKEDSSNLKSNDSTNKTEQMVVKKQDEGDVPSSSREFCNDLNFNLALNAAATSVGPVVVLDTSKSNERFTSNASTSSIHNDLKLILEQNKVKKVEQQPKSQRQNKSKHNDSLNSSSSSTHGESKKVDLVKLISMVSQNKKSYKDILIEMNINDGVKYRYTKDFLKQIKQERMGLIENICYPEIFRTFCDCVIGKQWDPERYFDMIQYPDNFNGEKQKTNYHNSKNNRKYNNNHQKGMLLMDSSAVESPQPLQVPKNSPKSAQSVKAGKKSNKREENPDNILLNLLKKNTQPKQNNNILDLLNNKQTTPVAKSPSKKVAKTNNLLDDLFKKSQPVQQQSQQPKHFPQVLTVQELEMTQFVPNNNKKNHNNHQRKNKTRHNAAGSNNTSTCSSTTTTSSTSSASNTSEDYMVNSNNNSDAYKQLVKNLSNHPLSTPPSATQKSSIHDDLLSKLQINSMINKQSNQSPLTQLLVKHQQLEQQRANETNMLKQILNLNLAKEEKAKHKTHKKHHHTHHHHKSHKQNEFPSINPHEKPFQSILPGDCVQMPSNPIENLLNKMNYQSSQQQQQQHQQQNIIAAAMEQQNFNHLLSKLMPTIQNTSSSHLQIENSLLQQQTNNKSNDILKWFNGANLNLMNNNQSQQHQHQQHQSYNYKQVNPNMVLSEIDLLRNLY